MLCNKPVCCEQSTLARNDKTLRLHTIMDHVAQLHGFCCSRLPNIIQCLLLLFQLDALDGSRAPEAAEAAMRSLLQEEETAARKRAQKEKKRIAQQTKKAATRLASCNASSNIQASSASPAIRQTPTVDPAVMCQPKEFSKEGSEAGSDKGSEGVLEALEGVPGETVASGQESLLGIQVGAAESAGGAGAEHSLAAPEHGSKKALLLAQLTCSLSKVGLGWKVLRCCKLC